VDYLQMKYVEIGYMCYNIHSIFRNSRGDKMRIALMSANLGESYSTQIKQIQDYLEDYLSVDLLCFGNQYLLGNRQLTGNYEEDIELAIDVDSKEILQLRGLAKKFRVGLGVGFVEKDEEGLLYNSYIILDKQGVMMHLHRSVSDSWMPNPQDPRYCRGNEYTTFNIRGLDLVVASYGDLEYMDNIVAINELNPDAIIWPITLSFNPTEWRNEGLNDLANQLKILDSTVLLVNSFSEDDTSSGGAYVFKEGNVKKELPLGNLGILIVSDSELRD